MASILEMAAARCSPRASEEGSSKRAGAPELGAGVGVDGAAGVCVLDDAGAAGGAGVAATGAGAGVLGAAAAGFGAAFGCEGSK